MTPENNLQPPILEEIISFTIGPEYIDPVYQHTGNLEYLLIFQLERLRILETHGIDLVSLADNEGLYAFMTQQSILYKGQTVLDDLVDIKTTIEENGLRLKFKHKMILGGNIVTEADCEYILVNKNGRPQRIPEELKARLKPPHD